MSAMISPRGGSPGALVFFFSCSPHLFIYLLTTSIYYFSIRKKKLRACIASESDYRKSIEGYELLRIWWLSATLKPFPAHIPTYISTFEKSLVGGCSPESWIFAWLFTQLVSIPPPTSPATSRVYGFIPGTLLCVLTGRKDSRSPSLLCHWPGGDFGPDA